MRPKFNVWVWTFEDGDPAYVGWGRTTINHPAKAIWAQRDKYESELNRWLRTLDREPLRSAQLYGQDLTKIEASTLASELRRLYKRKGFTLLDSRPDGTRLGGGRKRMVLGPDLELYESVRHAARVVGYHPSTITRYCQTEDSGWDYLPNPKES